MSGFIQYLLSGLGAGAVYALVALGFSIVYKVTRAINFAQGEMLMVNGILASILVSRFHVPLFVAALVVIVFGALLGLAVEVVAVRLLNRPDPLTMTLGTVAVGIALQAIMVLLTRGLAYSLPGFSGDRILHFGGVLLSTQTLWNLGLAALTAGLLTYLFARTRRGVSLRAAADDRDTASVFGVSFGSVTASGFAVAGALAATAGVAITPVTLMSSSMGTELGLVGFAAAMLGGLGNLPGAILGGLVVGVAEALVAGYVTSTYAAATGFVVLLVVLFLRPTGLFRVAAVERV